MIGKKFVKKMKETKYYCDVCKEEVKKAFVEADKIHFHYDVFHTCKKCNRKIRSYVNEISN